MDPKAGARQVEEAAKNMKTVTRTIQEGASKGTMSSIDLSCGVSVRLLCWAFGGDPDKPIELAIGPSKVRMQIGEAGLLMKMIERMMQGACVFEVMRDDMLDAAISNAKDGQEN